MPRLQKRDDRKTGRKARVPAVRCPDERSAEGSDPQITKVCWITKPYTVAGNGYGYSFHNRMMFEHTKKHGIEYDDEAKIAVQITSADKFTPIEGKINVLFSMWEFEDLPKSYIRAINDADYLIVPSSYVRDIFKKYTKVPIFVCREGVNPKDFPFHQRRLDGTKKFRYLWCGASNPRKGYQSVLQAVQLCDMFPNIELYIKTTMPKITWWGTLKQTLRHLPDIMFDTKLGKKRMVSLVKMWSRLPKPILCDRVTLMGKNKNVIFDTRNLPASDLTDLYNSANCFLLPSWGEGWGLTLCEAMATGCPAISLSATGQADFFDEVVGYPVKYSLEELHLDEYEGLDTKAHIPDTQDFIEQMLRVAREYPKALQKGRRASERIHKKFTWELSGQRMAEILKEIEKDADHD